MLELTAHQFKKKYPRVYKKIMSLYGGKSNILDFAAAFTLFKNNTKQPTCEICNSAVKITKKFRNPVTKVRCSAHINTNNIVDFLILSEFSKMSKYSIIETPNKKLTKTDNIILLCPQHGTYTQTIGFYLSGAQCQKCYHQERTGKPRAPHSEKTKKTLSEKKTGIKLNLTAAAKERKTKAQKIAWARRKENTSEFKKYTAA